ncbi:uncharacterized protein LOC131941656 [Physella acuta]|uniref:uncharacterized protein LOC131941656 n=1 Tax=Physella acuta TaxID=109671 RepID=UPI0027DBBB93|nr:uncharacterized protein LOC131941656 [Physella acuta]
MWTLLALKILPVLMFVVGVWPVCREVDWSDSFNKMGQSQCDSHTDIIQGFCRSDFFPSSGIDHIGLLESAICCTKPAPWTENFEFEIVDWWGVLDKPYASALCPTGQFLSGLYRTSGARISSIEEGRCTKAQNLPARYGCCYEQDISTCFSKTGCCTCDPGYYVIGFNRSDCDELRCLTKLQCCNVTYPETGSQ